MSVRWERLAGDTARFAVKLAFHSDPDAGQGCDVETAASWGALQFWVDGVNISTYVDQGETLQATHWYMLPFLEWIVANWDPILHEERLPPASGGLETAAELSSSVQYSILTTPDDPEALAADERRYAWQLRHAIRSARDGGIFPDFHMRRIRERVELSWSQGVLAGASEIYFLSPSGRSYQEPVIVGSALFAVVEEGTKWLCDQHPDSPRLATLAKAVREIAAPERMDGRVAWLAGLDGRPHRIVDRWRSLRDSARSWAATQQLEEAFSKTFSVAGDTPPIVLSGSCEAALLFGSVSPTVNDDDAKTLANLLLGGYVETPSARLSEYVEYRPIEASSPAWQQGYELALALLEEFEEAGLVDRDHNLDIRGSLVGLDVNLSDIVLSDNTIRAVSFVSTTHRPTIAINRSSPRYTRPTARRFTLAHELCHLLYDQEQGTRLAVASGPWAPKVVEQRANAFAAMLLMPPERLAKAITETSQGITTLDSLTELASRLEVSVSTLLEHAHNLRFFDDATYEELRTALMVDR